MRKTPGSLVSGLKPTFWVAICFSQSQPFIVHFPECLRQMEGLQY